MSDVAIRVENLSKLYQIGAQTRQDTLRDALVSAFRRHGARNEKDRFWALKDVSFEVKRGEAVGIIGRNGAGKSTLLKILSQITEPTSGRAEIRGRVASLLEVGTGFHPELTGRENIYLNGAILGMRRTEVAAKFDEIVAFSEIERFLDTPVKRYSSGMYVRLAFSVAAHLDPEILLVDEVLSVGDAAFQTKCLGKMSSVAHGGRTVFLVTHNMVALQSMCSRAVLLSSGRLVSDGESRIVSAAYVEALHGNVTEQSWADLNSAPGNNSIRLRSVRAFPFEGHGLNGLDVCTPVCIEIQYWNLVPETKQGVSIHLSDVFGTLVFANRSPSRIVGSGIVTVRCRIPGGLLNDGTYRITLAITQDDSSWLYGHEDALSFTLNDVAREGGWMGKWPGVIRPELAWQLEAPSVDSD